MSEINNDEKLKRYQEAFRKLGAKHPDLWAYSQVIEGNKTDFSTFAFLRQVASYYSEDCIGSSIDYCVERAKEGHTDLDGTAGVSINRMIESGADRQDIILVARMLIYDFFFHVCYLLDDSCMVSDFLDESMPKPDWQLFLADEEGKLTPLTSCLHDALDEFNPFEED